jgi:hypothetical protein
MMRCLMQRLPATGGREDLVLPGSQVDPECPDDLRLIVDDKHAGHDGT